MKLYLKMGLALAIAFVFLMTSKLLTSQAASAGAGKLRINAESRGVLAEARIHRFPPPDNGIEKANLDVGRINVDFPPGGSASAQFNNSEMLLLGTQIVASGPGSGATSITQMGPDAARAQSDYTIDEVYYGGNAITFERLTTRTICNVVSGKAPSCSKESVFKNLVVNGERLPNRLEPNTKRKFIRQVKIGDAIFNAEFDVTLNAQSSTTKGGKIEESLAGFLVRTRSLRGADDPGSQGAMLFDPFRIGIKTGGPNTGWAPSYLTLPGAKIKRGQTPSFDATTICGPIDVAAPVIH